MPAPINQRLLTSLKAQPRPYEVRDVKVKGFILRVQPSGVLTYIVEYGRGKRITLGRAFILTPTQARTRAIETLQLAAQGEDPKAARPNRTHTLRSFIEDQYRPWVQAHHRWTGAVQRLEKCFGWLFDKKLVEIGPLELERWRTQRLQAGIKPATVNRDLVGLKALLNKAVEWRALKVNGLSTVKPLKVDHQAVVRYLTEDEETRLRAALAAREARLRQGRENGNAWREARRYAPMSELSDYLKPMVLISLNTGLRRGELFTLAWVDVDLEHRNLTVRGQTAKSQITRHIPLNTEALSVLRDWKVSQRDPGLVFPGRTGERLDNTRKSWASVLSEAGITGFRWHDLRHTFASKLVMGGVDLNTVRELLGHADIKMTLRYAHLAPAHKAKAVEVLSRR